MVSTKAQEEQDLQLEENEEVKRKYTKPRLPKGLDNENLQFKHKLNESGETIEKGDKFMFSHTLEKVNRFGWW